MFCGSELADVEVMYQNLTVLDNIKNFISSGCFPQSINKTLNARTKYRISMLRVYNLGFFIGTDVSTNMLYVKKDILSLISVLASMYYIPYVVISSKNGVIYYENLNSIDIDCDYTILFHRYYERGSDKTKFFTSDMSIVKFNELSKNNKFANISDVFKMFNFDFLLYGKYYLYDEHIIFNMNVDRIGTITKSTMFEIFNMILLSGIYPDKVETDIDTYQINNVYDFLKIDRNFKYLKILF
jgi:hypothetical protein